MCLRDARDYVLVCSGALPQVQDRVDPPKPDKERTSDIS